MTDNYSLPSTPLFTNLVGTQAARRRGESDEHVRLSDDQLAGLRAAAESRRFTTGEVLSGGLRPHAAGHTPLALDRTQEVAGSSPASSIARILPVRPIARR